MAARKWSKEEAGSCDTVESCFVYRQVTLAIWTLDSLDMFLRSLLGVRQTVSKTAAAPMLSRAACSEILLSTSRGQAQGLRCCCHRLGGCSNSGFWIYTSSSISLHVSSEAIAKKSIVRNHARLQAGRFPDERGLKAAPGPRAADVSPPRAASWLQPQGTLCSIL